MGRKPKVIYEDPIPQSFLDLVELVKKAEKDSVEYINKDNEQARIRLRWYLQDIKRLVKEYREELQKIKDNRKQNRLKNYHDNFQL